MNKTNYIDVNCYITKRIGLEDDKVDKEKLKTKLCQDMKGCEMRTITGTVWGLVIGSLQEISEIIKDILTSIASNGKAELIFNDNTVINLECKYTNRIYCFMTYKNKSRIADMTVYSFIPTFIKYVKDLLKDTNVDTNLNNVQLKYITDSIII